MSIAQNFPNLKPTLLLDFANTESLDPRITFTRASTATYYGTETAKAEENLLLQSQDITTTWTNVGSTDSANTTTAPDGTSTAGTLTESATNSSHDVRQTGVAVTSGLRYVWSIFAKKGDGATAPDIIQLTWATGGFGVTVFANYDISVGGGTSGTVTTTGAGAVSASIVDVGNEWYRCVLIADATATATSGMSVLFTNNNPTATRGQSYLGVTTANAFLWGAQLEQRSAATAYTPTTTQAITNYIPVLETAASGVARFDHNPTTFESLGLLVEEQRANLLTYSEQFDNAAWTKTNSTITANTVVAPDGALTGDKLVEDTANGNHLAQEVANFVSGTSYTTTFYAKAGERNRIRVQGANTVTYAALASFDLSDGTVVSSGPGTASIANVGNGWYRCSVTGTAGATAATNVQISLIQSGTNNSYTGDGYSGLYLWGAQLEAGAFPTSYIPTVASQVTRAADAASMTGANFSSWYRQDEGSLYAEWAKIAPSAFQSVAIASDGTSNNVVAMGHGSISGSNNSLRVDVSVGGVTQASMTTVSNSLSSTFYKTSGAYKVNDFAVVTNGGAAGTDTSGTLPVVNRLNIGANATGNGSFLNGHLRKIAFYPKRLSNTELQGLTS